MDDRPLPPDWVFIAIRVLIGGFLYVPGLLLIGSAAGVMDVIPWASRIPPWAALLTALPVISAGVMIASGLKSFGDDDTSVSPRIKLILLLTFLVPLALAFLWTGFGPGERKFTVTTTISLPFIDLTEEETSAADELTGRLLFGGSGIFMTVVVLLYTHTFFRKRR